MQMISISIKQGKMLQNPNLTLKDRSNLTGAIQQKIHLYVHY